MSKRAKTSAEIQAELSKLDEERKAVRRALDVAKRREAAEAAAAKAEADARLAARLLGVVRKSLGDDAGDDVLTAAVEALLGLTVSGLPAPEWALTQARKRLGSGPEGA
ncbi:hypothetical protein E0L17_01375 [Olsenella sp. SW781]|uniref:hypothetical protein n=1 Tax=Olsenella sp. SW781 TaxID=2530046 RepID=UPI00143B1525|nr:hypothetical protein [Olsenella sp. SW781]NJE79989.1 hypothetical protein [Olsenella sp. SW781]